MFWLVSLLLGSGGKPDETLVWVIAVFISILIHELGHALLARRFGAETWVTLYSLGGLASYRRGPSSPARQIAISLAGPGAGFLLAAAVLLVAKLMGKLIVWYPIGPVGMWDVFDIENPKISRLTFDVLYICTFWGLVNLLPVYPLDGGQVARNLFMAKDPFKGINNSLWLSLATATTVAVYAASHSKDMFMAMFFGMMAFSNYQQLHGPSGGNYGR
jgi:membrane-associated protease RseP (regulator of RpoE activity)